MSLARLIVRRRWWVALGWLAAAALLLPAACGIADVLDVEARVEGSESAAVEGLLEGPLASAYARVAVLVVGGTVSPAALERITARIEASPLVGATFSSIDGGDSLFTAAHGAGTFVLVGLAAGDARPDHVIGELRRITAALGAELGPTHPGLTLRWTGEAALNVDMRAASSADVARAERRALPLTAILLFFAFGAVAAGLLPVACGALAIGLALGVAALLARFWPLSILLQSVVSMLGLGLGIDYGLLMVSRFREATAAGMSSQRAAEDAAHHAGHTILLSAIAVAIGFTMLLAVPLSEIRAIAIGGLLVVATSALVATTLLPAALSLLGGRIGWGRIRRRDASARAARRWRRLGQLVTGHPWTALLAGSLPLLLLATQAARLEIGLPRGNWLPASLESSRALDDLRAMGRGGVINAVRVVIAFPPGAPVGRSAGWNALAAWTDSLAADPRIERVHSVVTLARAVGLGRSALYLLPDSAMRGLVDAEMRLALVELLPHDSIDAQALTSFVRELRRHGADRLGVPGARVMVGGLPAFNADYGDAAAGRFLEVAGLVLGATLLALFAGTRSLLVPVKAVALNLLSVAAAFGAVALAFPGAVFSTLPIIVFCVVFGLSMDYEVFLITRVMEERRAGRGDREAIVEALGATGQVITSAAAIMLVVFAAFTTGSFLFVRMLGFALAVAVLLDATLVRMVIGPALLQLAGRWNWWPGRVILVASPAP
jgi:RND superfamily putative drug exporter